MVGIRSMVSLARCTRPQSSKLTHPVVCRDYDQVISYLESVRAYDDKLIY